MGNAGEFVQLKPFVSGRPIESFNVSVLSWLPGLDIYQRYSLFVRALHQCLRDVLWSIIAAKGGGLTTPFNDLIQCPYHPCRGQRQIDFDVQPLSRR